MKSNNNEELQPWIDQMRAEPSMADDAAYTVQQRINKILPDRFHRVVTAGLKQMTKAVLFGAGKTTSAKEKSGSVEERTERARKIIGIYRTSAATEGAITGFGGIMLGVADLPLWLSIKMKMLFEIASVFGFDTRDYRERLFIMHIFQLTFSSQESRNQVFDIIENWEQKMDDLPDNLEDFDWRTFQLEYRDYLDLAKLLQLIPGVGALVGAVVNHRLTEKLGRFATNCYLLRIRNRPEGQLPGELPSKKQ